MVCAQVDRLEDGMILGVRGEWPPFSDHEKLLDYVNSPALKGKEIIVTKSLDEPWWVRWSKK